MSSSSESDHERPEKAESFTERIDTLFEELSFAIQWRRPSILLVLHESEYIRGMAELALEKRLAEIGQRIVPFSVDERHFDIPLWLSQRPDRDRSIFSVTGLFRGGGKEGANAYRALNIRREYFVDYAIRGIIWLAEGEAIALSRHAPDFWAFRHRVVEFNDSSDPERFAASAKELYSQPREFSSRPEVLDEQIELLETLQAKLPEQLEYQVVRLDLVTALASLYQAKVAYAQAVQQLKQGIVIAQQLNNVEILARFFRNLGLIYLDLDQLKRAIRAYRKAIRFTPWDAGLWIDLGQIYLEQDRTEAARTVFKKAIKVSPQDANAWINLGHLHRMEKRFSDAIIAYQQSVQQDPQNPAANSSLMACYRLLGKDDLFFQQRKLTKPLMENETEYNRAIFESVCGNANKAIKLLVIALDKKQVGVKWVRRDPNLDFIRNDPHFRQLSGIDDSNAREQQFSVQLKTD